MLEFFKSHKFKILIAVVALLFGMMLYSASGDGIANIPKNLLEMVATPFQRLTSAISRETGNFLDIFLNAGNTAKENDELKAQLSDYNQMRIEYEKLKEENEQLKKAGGIKDLNSDFQMAIASVVSRDPADRYGSFIIDKGSLNDIAVNDPVMTEAGLVGIVTKVGPISSRVQTLLSPEVDISVKEITSKELGVVEGDVKLAEQGFTKMSILSGSTVIKQDDLIVTAGASGIFPKNLPVGTVSSVEIESHGVTKYAILKPLEDVTSVDTVMVITDFLGQGSELIDYTK